MKRLMVVGALAAGLCFVSDLALAQTGSVRGKVKDENDEPVVDATVLLEFTGGVAQKYETKTNKKGEFIQVGMRTGEYRITVSKDGYQGTFIETRIRLGDATNTPPFLLRSRAAALKAAAEATVAKVQGAFDAAIALTRDQKWDEAEAAFRALAEENPEIAELHYNLGYIATQKKDWATAEAAFQKAIETRPDYADAHVALSKVYSDSGQPEKAMESLAKVAAEHQGDATVQFNLGIQYFNNNHFLEAQAAFEKAIAANPDLAEAYYHLGNVLVNQGKIPEAVEKFDKYLSLNPTNPQNAAMAKQMVEGLRQYIKQ